MRTDRFSTETIPGPPSQVYPLIIAVLGILFFFPFLGAVPLFDWDEINFAESAREMLLTGNYTRVQIDYQPFWEKPPLFFWMQALSMKVFGINEFAARFPNAVFGVLTLLTLYYIGKKLYNPIFGLLWSLCYLGSFLPHLYFKSGIIDPVFNYFIFLGIYFLATAVAHYKQKGAGKYALLAGIAIGLAVLTKGPVGFLILLLTFMAYWISLGLKAVSKFKHILLFALAVFGVSFLWFGLETIKNGFWFLEEFIVYQIRLFSTPDAGHKQPWFYHFVVVFLGCFPMSVFALRAFFFRTTPDYLNFRRWMIILFWVVMILFTIVTTKIVHYSSMAYFPVSFLAAYYLFFLIQRRLPLQKFVPVLVGVIGLVLALLLAVLPLVALNKEKIIPYIKDPFAVANLQAQVYWSGWESLIGVGYFLLIILGVVLLVKKRFFRATSVLFLSTALCLLLYSRIVVPKIEKYTQGAAIRFYKSLQGEDAYVDVVGFKSYAHLFYFRKPPVVNEKSYDEQWLLEGDIDKPVYFVTKIDRVAPYRAMPQLKELGEQNGFVFFKRYP